MALHHNIDMEHQTKELCDRHGAEMMRLNTVHSCEPILQLTEGRRDAYRKLLLMGSPVAEVHPCECRWRHCGESFIRQEALVSHVNMAHVNVERDVEYRCHWADCPRRGKGFNARYKMMIHIRTHTNEKPHPCGICSKRFLRLENLKIHIRSHTGEKPYICPFEGCKKAYSNSSDRFKHVRTHLTEKPYACKMPGCNKCYTDPSSLRKHVKTNGHNVAQLHHHMSHGLPAFQHSIKELPSTFYITNGGAHPIMSQSSSLSGGYCSLPEQVVSLQGSTVHLSALMSNPLLSSAVIAPLVSTQTTSTQTDSEVPPEVTSMYKTLVADTDSLSDVSNDSQQDLPLDLTMNSTSSSELQSDAQSQSSDDAHYSSTSRFLESGHYSPIWRSFTP